MAQGDEKAASDDLEGAIKDYKAATLADPSYAEAHKKLGKALFRKGDKAGAVSAFKRYLDVDPDAADAKQIKMIVKQFDR